MKLLILEGDSTLDRADDVRAYADQMIAAGGDIEVRFIFNVYQAKKELLLNLFEWCDTIAFQSTFTESGSIGYLGTLLERINHSVAIVIDHPEAERKVDNLLDDEGAWKLRLHSFYRLDRDIQYGGYKRTLIDLSAKVTRWEAQLLSDKIYIDSRKTATTGRKVRIGKVQAVGKQFSNLKEGEIVDEIDNSERDPNPDRGIWVWGLTEPVKLLNEYPYAEYLIESLHKDDLISEILKTVSVESDDGVRYLLGGILAIDATISWMANEMCEQLGVEKRGNRGRIQELLLQVTDNQTLKII